MFKLMIYPFGLYNGNEKVISSDDYGYLHSFVNLISAQHTVSILNPFGAVLFHRSSILNLSKGGK